jgi:4'-phosphopantetheinyl transferase
MRIERLLDWAAPGTAPGAARRVVAKVWRVALDIGSADLDRAYALLASDEKARAARYVLPMHRRRFVAARAAAREILAGQLAIAPRGVAFRCTAEGKPELIDHPELHFSVTHSDDLCLIALSRGRRLGIDVEAMRADRVLIDEVARSLHPAERQALAALKPPLLELAFYRCWVRKEALLKALGIGLGGGLDRFHVSVGEEPRLIWSDPTLLVPAEWTLIDLAGLGYAATLAVETRVDAVEPCFRLAVRACSQRVR